MSIRPQYHFRQGSDGLRAWNVARLIRLSNSLPTFEKTVLELREIDEAYWSTDSAGATVRWVADHARLIAECDTSLPIILCAQGRIMDGSHRLARAYMDNRETLPVKQFPITPEHDFCPADPATLPYDPKLFEI